MRATVSFQFQKTSLTNFKAQCEAAIRNLGRGTKKATIAACEEILAASLLEVPRDTQTLAASGFYKVSKRTDVKSYAYEGVVGYGGNGDPVNPKTGHLSSSYMVAVHEDMNAKHLIGKAKFLEDPVREYGSTRFEKTIFKYAQESLATMSSKEADEGGPETLESEE